MLKIQRPIIIDNLSKNIISGDGVAKVFSLLVICVVMCSIGVIFSDLSIRAAFSGFPSAH